MSNKDLLVFLGACYVAGAIALLLNLEEYKFFITPLAVFADVLGLLWFFYERIFRKDK
jgi:hypothetical protein